MRVSGFLVLQMTLVKIRARALARSRGLKGSFALALVVLNQGHRQSGMHLRLIFPLSPPPPPLFRFFFIVQQLLWCGKEILPP